MRQSVHDTLFPQCRDGIPLCKGFLLHLDPSLLRNNHRGCLMRIPLALEERYASMTAGDRSVWFIRLSTDVEVVMRSCHVTALDSTSMQVNMRNRFRPSNSVQARQARRASRGWSMRAFRGNCFQCLFFVIYINSNIEIIWEDSVSPRSCMIQDATRVRCAVTPRNRRITRLYMMRPSSSRLSYLASFARILITILNIKPLSLNPRRSVLVRIFFLGSLYHNTSIPAQNEILKHGVSRTYNSEQLE